MFAWEPAWACTLTCSAPKILSVRRSHRPRAEDGDVGIVVQAGEPGRVVVVEDRGADPGDPVGRDRHPDAGPADEHAGVRRPRGDPPGARRGVVGIVNRFPGGGPEVLRGNPEGLPGFPQAL